MQRHTSVVWRALASLAIALWACTGVAAAQSGRIFEMVSPPSKNNASILSAMPIDASRVEVISSASMLESDPFHVGAGLYVASRSLTSGWTFAFSRADTRGNLADYLAGGDRIYESTVPLSGEADDGVTDVYRWSAGSFSAVSVGAAGGQGPFPASYVMSSADGDHVLFRTEEQLDARDSGRDPGTSMLYERVGDQTRAVGLDSDGQLLDSGGAILAGDGPGALTPVGEGGTTHPISADGSRIFFESPDPAVGGNTQLYVREQGQTTVQVSASQRSTPGNGPLPVRFAGAAEDGSRVLFRTAAQLVDGDEDDYADLYAYDLATGDLSRLSAGQQDAEAGLCPADGVEGLRGVCGVVAISEDARRVYYLSTGAVAPGGVAGKLNLYLHDTGSGQTSAVVSVPNDLVTTDGTVGGLYQAGLDRLLVRAETTPDGSVLAFMADSALTGFDTSGPGCPAGTQGRCAQVYRYDADTDEIVCVSCNSTDASPLGPAEVPVMGAVPSPDRRFLSPDGARVAFETPDPLVLADVDDQVDVYEWRDGQVSLVSPGDSPRRSTFVGYGPDASDLFLLTGESLLPQDTDTLTDLYDARIGSEPPGLPGPPSPCVEDACQGAYRSPPSVQAPATVAPDGGGNVVSRSLARVALVRIAPTGRGMRVTVRVTRAGRVAVSAATRLGGRQRIVARAVKRARGARTLKLDVALGSKARRELRRKQRLKLTVTARLSTAARHVSEAITLRIGAAR